MRRFRLGIAVAVGMTAAGPAFAGCSVSGFVNGFTNSTSGTVCGIPVTVSQNYTEAQLKALTSISGTLNGMAVTITSGSSYDAISASNTMTVYANGHTVVFTTSDTSFAAGNSNFSLTVTVDGKTIFSGNPNTVVPQDAINLLIAIGMYDSYAATQQAVSRAASRATMTQTSNRITTVLAQGLAPTQHRQKRERDEMKRSDLPGGTGISTGENEKGVGLWASPSNTWVSSSDPLARFAGTMQSLVSGLDMKVTQDTVVGLAIGLENSSIRTIFNQGNVDVQAVSFTPYFGIGFFDSLFTFDFMGSYAYYSGIQKRFYTEGTTVKGQFTGQRWMLASNLNLNLSVTDNFSVTTTLGGMATWDHRFRFYESDGTRPLKNDSGLGEGKLALKMAYAFDDFDVYSISSFTHAFIQDQDITSPDQHYPRRELIQTLGVNWPVADNQLLSFEVSNSFFRAYTHQTGVALNYRYTF